MEIKLIISLIANLLFIIIGFKCFLNLKNSIKREKYNVEQWRRWEAEYWRLRFYVQDKGIENIWLSWLPRDKIAEGEHDR